MPLLCFANAFEDAFLTSIEAASAPSNAGFRDILQQHRDLYKAFTTCTIATHATGKT